MPVRWILLCSAVLATAVSQNARIARFYAEDEIVSPRQTIKLICEFSNLQYGTTQHLNKHYGNTTYKITTDLELVREVNRYTFHSEEPVNSNVRQTLTITDASSVDSGNYSCSLIDRNKNTSEWKFLTIAVEDQPDSIRVFLDDVEIRNGTTPSTQLKLLTMHRIRCETNGSNPAANITVTFGGKELHQCNRTISPPIYRYDLKDSEADFLIPVQYSTTAMINHWKLETDAFSGAVVCSARVDYDTDHEDEPPITTTFYPIVADDVPQIECNDTVFGADKQKNFQITCVVFSKPTLLDADFFFKVGETEERIEGFSKGTPRFSKNGQISGIVKEINEIQTNMTLTINQLDLKAINKFNFEAKNSRGQDIHSVTVVDKMSISLASPLLSPAYVVFLLAFATVVLRHCWY